MKIDEVASAYERLLRDRFSEHLVCRGYLREGDPSDPFVRVLFIPDDRDEEFMDFSIDELPALLDDLDLPDVTLVPYGLGESLEHFPDLAAEVAIRFT